MDKDNIGILKLFTKECLQAEVDSRNKHKEYFECQVCHKCGYVLNIDDGICPVCCSDILRSK
jgi:ribosomal protein L40E